jgi:hypothetical protein
MTAKIFTTAFLAFIFPSTVTALSAFSLGLAFFRVARSCITSAGIANCGCHSMIITWKMLNG